MDLPPMVQVWMCEANEGNSDRDIYSKCYRENERAIEIGRELALGLGWAAAGDMNQAMQHGIEALRMQAEHTAEMAKETYEGMKDFFKD